ncbi:MAG: histidine--tRNA ligase [Lachnospiraceae bacterium]|nr:histidine--tRNA ligase [Lachnospiraceae bacterium]
MNKKPVNGMRDVLPSEMELRSYVLSVIRDTYRSYGFTEMETPVVESIENLQGRQGGENEKLIFKIMKRGEKLRIDEAKEENDLADSGLRYDLTVPLSRYYAAHEAELPKPFKALQIGPVFRAERPQKGRFREFYQCDIDILGESTKLAETELILATTEAVSRLGFKSFVIRINDRRFLKAMAASTGLSEELYGDLFIALDKMDKIGTEGVREELLKLGMEEEKAETLLQLFTALEEGDGSTERIRAFQDKLGQYLDPAAADDLVDIIETVEKAAEGRIVKAFSLAFDPTLVRGMGYYTGPIFEISTPEFGSSVGGGGRYDEMVGRFLGQQVPACGFSIGFERIISILMDQGFKVPQKAEKTAFLLDKRLAPEEVAEVMKKAEELRRNGAIVLVQKMAKNKKFQRDQLEAAGYTRVEEFFRD